MKALIDEAYTDRPQQRYALVVRRQDGRENTGIQRCWISGALL